MRYELRNDELAIFFTQDEVNIALSYENSMRRGRGLSSGELMYGCMVDSINEKTGIPTVGWRDGDGKADIDVRSYPASVESNAGQFVVRTLDGRSVESSSGVLRSS